MRHMLSEVKDILGNFDSGEREELKDGQVIQHFGWECGCKAQRPLGDGPVGVKLCRKHTHKVIRRAR